MVLYGLRAGLVGRDVLERMKTGEFAIVCKAARALALVTTGVPRHGPEAWPRRSGEVLKSVANWAT